MAISDTLNVKLKAEIVGKLARTNDSGSHTGTDQISHSVTQTYADGSGSGQASVWFASQFAATTGGITVSLADSSDPLGGAGDEAPTADPEGLKLRALLIENTDTSNYVTVGQGTNGESSILSGSTDTIRIDPGGCFLWMSPAGNNAMNDGSDDELSITADTASCTVNISALYG